MGTIELNSALSAYRLKSRVRVLPLAVCLFVLAGGLCFAQPNDQYARQNPQNPVRVIPSALLPPQNQLLPNNTTPKSPAVAKTKEDNPQYTPGWSLAIEPHAGMRYGFINEIIWYPKSYTRSQKKLSLLEWDIKPAWYVGAEVDITYKRFEVAFDGKVIVPGNMGGKNTIRDHDWMQGLYAPYGFIGSFDVKTNYSESQNDIVRGYDFDLTMSYKFYPTSKITLRPKLAANYYRMSFDAKGGWYSYGKSHEYTADSRFSDLKDTSWYPYNDPANSVRNQLPDHTVLTFDAHTLYVWLGFQADFFPARWLRIMLSTEAAPFMYIYSEDNHPLRETIFLHQSYSVFFGLRQKLQISFAVTKHVALNARGAFVWTAETEGRGFVIQNNKTYRTASNSGTQLMYFDAGLGLRLSW